MNFYDMWLLNQGLPPPDTSGSNLGFNVAPPLSSPTPYPNMLNPVSVSQPTVPASYPPQPYNIPPNPWAPPPPPSITDLPGGELLPPPPPGSQSPNPPPPETQPPQYATNSQVPGVNLSTRDWLSRFHLPTDWGGWGEPMGHFGPGTTMPPGTRGVVNPSSPAGGGFWGGGGVTPGMLNPTGRDNFNPAIPGNLNPFVLNLPGSFAGLGSFSGGSIEGIGGKLFWHAAQPMYGGRTLAQVARQNPELLPGLANMGFGFTGGSPAQKVGAGSSGRTLSPD